MGDKSEGTRGGKDRFNWEEVKKGRHLFNYLGNSLKAPVDRRQQGRDFQWYTREDVGTRGDKAMLAEEKRLIKEHEQRIMLEQLGMTPPVKKEEDSRDSVSAEMKDVEERSRHSTSSTRSYRRPPDHIDRQSKSRLKSPSRERYSRRRRSRESPRRRSREKKRSRDRYEKSYEKR